jgi:hypothetical protein
MSKLSYKARKKLSAGKFVFPHGTKAAPGKKKFPIHDKKHARQALSRAAQKRTKLTAKERCEVVKVVCRRYPDVGMCAGVGHSKLASRCGV